MLRTITPTCPLTDRSTFVRPILARFASEIRPRSYDIEYAQEGNVISHGLEKPRYLTYLINDEKPLFLLTSPIDKNRPEPGTPGIIDMLSAYGLDNTGERDETETIQQAIDEASANGGATLLFRDGVYKVKQLKIKTDYIDLS